MSLIDSMLNPGPEIYYDPEFRNVFEDHLSWLHNERRSSITITTTDENTGARFAGDWRGLMTELGIVPHMAWFHMRINGYAYSSEYDGKQISIFILRDAEVDKLAAQFRTKKKN